MILSFDLVATDIAYAPWVHFVLPLLKNSASLLAAYQRIWAWDADDAEAGTIGDTASALQTILNAYMESKTPEHFSRAVVYLKMFARMARCSYDGWECANAHAMLAACLLKAMVSVPHDFEGESPFVWS